MIKLKLVFLIFFPVMSHAILCEGIVKKFNIKRVQKIAQKWDADAQYRLGRKYYKLENFLQSVYLFKRSAEQGHVEAYFELDHMYRKGEGVIAHAFHWFKEVAEQE